MKHLSYCIVFIRKIISFVIWLYNFTISLWFNFAMLPLRQAVKMPIWLDRPKFVRLERMCKTCHIIIEAETINFAMIKLGIKYNSWNPYRGITLQLYGDIVFKGKAVIGNSSTIYVANDSKLIFGENFIAASGFIVGCQKMISFGKDDLIGWNCSFFDTDFHHLTNHETGMIYEKKGPIFIGNNNWIGCNTSVFKGFKSNDDTVISAHSICKKRIVARKKSTIGCTDQLTVINDKVYYNPINDK